MRTLLLFFFVLASACSWNESWPIPVVTKHLSPSERASAAEAITEWNALLPTDAFAVRDSIPDGHFYVVARSTAGDVAGNPDIAGRTGNFRARRKHWAEITFRADLEPEIMRAMFAHELGHVLLGGEHSADPSSILFSEYQKNAHVSEADADAVIEAYGLQVSQ